MKTINEKFDFIFDTIVNNKFPFVHFMNSTINPDDTIDKYCKIGKLYIDYIWVCYSGTGRIIIRFVDSIYYNANTTKIVIEKWNLKDLRKRNLINKMYNFLTKL